MDSTRQIVIADNYFQRFEEMDRLAQSLKEDHPNDTHIFDCSLEQYRDLVSAQAVKAIRKLFDTHSDIVLVTNCTVGVKHKLFSQVRELEQETKKSVRKVLLTCQKGWEIRFGFAQRGVSLDGIEHVVWDVRHPLHHRERMKSIFQGNPPEENPL